MRTGFAIAVAAAAALGARADELRFGDGAEALRTRTAEVMSSQTATDEKQLSAETRLGFVPERVAHVLALQSVARASQEAANRAQSEVGRIVGEMGFKAWEIERLEGGWSNDVRRARSAEADLPAARQRLAQAEAELAAATNAAAAAAQAAGADAKAARSEAREAARQIENLTRALGPRRSDVASLARQAAGAGKQAGSMWVELSARWQAVARAARSELAAALEAAAEAQDRARRDQAAAYEALRALKSAVPADPAAGDALPAEPTAAQAGVPEATGAERGGEDPLSPEELAAMAADDLFRTAAAVQSNITARYVSARAAELAMIRSVPKRVAAQSVDAPPAPAARVDLQKLSQPAGTVEDMDGYRAELRTALDAVNAMAASGRELLAAAGGGTSGESGVSLANVMAGVEVSQALEGNAADSDAEQAKDLTALMNAAYGAEAGGNHSPGSDGQEGGREGGGAVSSGPGSFKYAPFSPEHDGRGGPSRGGYQVRINPFDGDAPGPEPQRRPELSPAEYADDKTMFAAIPGRRVQAGLGGATWMYVDSWYLIGPFPNPDRRNIEREFPPEAGVDLDAVYEGQDGRPVHWDFVQVGQPVVRFTGSYSIYYAYAELWFDEPREMWVALGSDDGSRLYLNDLLIWKTVRAKAWRINEAYRKVSFKKGLNRVLYRVENGPAHGWFSFLLHVQPPERG